MQVALYPDMAWDCPTAPPSDRLWLNVVTLPSDFTGRLLLLLRRGGFPPDVLSILLLDSRKQRGNEAAPPQRANSQEYVRE